MKLLSLLAISLFLISTAQAKNSNKKIEREPSASILTPDKITEDFEYLCESPKISVAFVTSVGKTPAVFLLTNTKEKMGYKLSNVALTRMRCPHCFDLDGTLYETPYEFAIRSVGMKTIDVDIEATVMPNRPSNKKPKIKKYNDVPCEFVGNTTKD